MKRLVSISVLLVTLVLGFYFPVGAQTETPPAPPVGSWKGIVTGKLVNRTPGASVPGPLDIMLHGFDQDGNQALMLHGKSQSDGTYRFSDVDFQSGVQVSVMASYQDAAYYSDEVDIQPAQKNLEFTVPIYETTTDLATVSIEAMHVLFYTDVQGLSVTEVYVLGNQGDRTVKDVVDLPRDRKGTLKFSLPEDAKNVTFDTQEPDRFVLLPDGFVDTAPITPGSRSSQVVVNFNLSYQDKLDFLSQPPVPVDSVSLLIPEESGLKLQGEGIVSQGIQNMQGTNYALYTGQSLKADEQLNLILSGNPKRTDADGTAASLLSLKLSKNTSLTFGVGAFGLALIIAGIYWWRKSTEDEKEFDEEDELIEEDDQHDD